MKVKTFKASFYIVGYLLEPDVESGTKRKNQNLMMKSPPKNSQILHFSKTNHPQKEN
jgi:hypothetical protein